MIASVTPAVLRRLHAGAPLRRGQALHLPLRGPRARPARPAPRRRLGRRARRRRSQESGDVRDDRYSELRSEATDDLTESRDELHRRLARRPPGAAPPNRIEWMSMPVVAAGRRHLPRGWADLGRQLAIWFGFAVLYQLARGIADRNPSTARSRTASAVVNFETHLTHRLYELTFQHFVDQRHLLETVVSLDLLELRVHGRRPGGALGLPAPPRGVRRLPQLDPARQRDRPDRLRLRARPRRRGCSASASSTSTATGSSAWPRTRTRRCRACTPPTR